MGPALDVLRDDQPHRSSDVVRAVADVLKLSEEDRSQTIPLGHAVYQDRAHWAISHMFQAGWITAPPAVLCGSRRLAATHWPVNLISSTIAFLAQYPICQEFRRRKGTRTAAASNDAESVTRSDVSE